MVKFKNSKRAVSLILSVLMLLSMVTCCMFSVNAAKDNTVYVEASGWTAPTCYVWGGTSGANSAWPGVAMTKVEGDIWSYTLPGDQVNIIFNDAGANKTADLVIPGADKLYSIATGTWSDYSVVKEPTAVASVDSGKAFTTESMDVTLTLKNATSGTYSVDGGKKIDFTGAVTVPVGKGKIGNTEITLDVEATDGTATTTKSFTYKKNFKVTGGGGTSGDDGHTTEALGLNYSTNAAGYGTNKTITVDGDPSDWDSSMKIAQGVANDDPRVYRPNSMYEKGVDDYALYAAWDDTKLYLMWEMANVSDVVSPNDDFPISQGNLWIDNLPYFIYFSLDNNKKGNGTDAAGGTIWNSGITSTAHVDTIFAGSTNGANGPFLYASDENGVFDFGDKSTLVTKLAGISEFKYSNGILSEQLIGIDKAYGINNNRVPGDTLDESAAWVDFNTTSHNSAKLDMTYEISIPLDKLGIDKAYIEENGIGIMKVSTFGTSGMNSLPADPSMWDNADLPYSVQEPNSNEKEDIDNITVPLARIGKALTGGTVTPATMQVNFGASKASPQAAGTAMTLQANSYNGTAPYTYSYEVNGKAISGTGESVNWTPATAGEYTLKVTAKDSTGATATSTKSFTVVEGGVTPPPTVVMGDVNNDGKVTMLDVSCLQDYFADKYDIEDGSRTFIASDVNKDGVVTMRDVKMIQDYLSDIIDSLD